MMPSGLTATEISFALFEINNVVGAIAEPPIASVESLVLNFDPNGNDIDDYRPFDVNFEPQATPEQMQEAVNIVARSFRRIIESR